MSLRALLQAVRDTIRDGFGLDKMACQVSADGRPDPDAGDEFWAVHPGGLANTAAMSLDERADLLVTLTLRTAATPQDRLGEEAIIADDGVLAKAERCRALLHMNYGVLDRANVLIPGTAGYLAATGGDPDDATANGFTEPLVFGALQYHGPQGPHWFFAEGINDDCTGLAVQLSFGRARRVQSTANQT